MAVEAKLLPPSSTPLERAFASLSARVGDVVLPVEQQLDPATIPIANLPWLAWSLSIDHWDAEWSDDEKRAAVANSIAQHRLKGSRASADDVLASFDELATIVEWFEAEEPRDPYTFEIRLPVVDADGKAGGRRVLSATQRAIVAEIAKVKPTRAHFDLVMDLAVEGLAAPIGAAQASNYRRLGFTPADTSGVPWGDLIQTEDGEPIQDDMGEMIDGSAA